MGSSSSFIKNKNIYSSTRAREIKIGGFDFTLRFVDEDETIKHQFSANFDSRAQEIVVSGSRRTFGESILHECFHGCDWQVAGGNDDRPEDYVHRLSYFFYAFLRSNPELVIRMLAENREQETSQLLVKLSVEFQEQ